MRFSPNMCVFLRPLTEAIIVTIISSLISGLIGVGVASLVFYKLERHKLKLDLARRLLGYRFHIQGDNFSCAVNEVIAVFADKPEVLLKMGRLYESLQTPGKPNAEGMLSIGLQRSGLVLTPSNLTPSNISGVK